jgi:phospholipid/cholesterol/gamma-HCH transport system ATP-binding protein
LTSAEIDELLLGLKSRTTTLIVTHNIPGARRMGDRLALLHSGVIAAEGTAVELARSEVGIVREFMRSEGSG